MPSATLNTVLTDGLAVPRPADWTALREVAEGLLEGAGLPTTREEAWKYTDLKALEGRSFQQGALLEAEIAEHILPEARGTRLVFVNGHFAPHLSSTGSLPAGVRFLHLASASEAATELGTLATPEASDPFARLNTARFQDGAYLFVPKGLKVEPVLHLVFLSRAELGPSLSFPRLYVVLEKGSEATLVEEYAGQGAYLTSAVVEVQLQEGARLTHERVQRESPEAFHFSTLSARLGRHAHYLVRTVSLGARLSRQVPQILLAEEGAELEIDGLALLSQAQLSDTHSCIDHAVPACRTRQMHKSIVDGKARSVFNGRILVRPHAQQTDARQQARSLLLSGEGRVDAKPELEIYADDVKCAHGAAIGQLDPEELFYLRSRGMSPTLAQNLLTYAFAADVLSTISVLSLRRQLRKAVLERTCATGLEV